MIAEERKARIVELVNANGAVSVTDLMDTLGSSESTVRRDLSSLHKAGLVKRVHGGATMVSSFEMVMMDQTLERRHAINADEKRAIGAHAAGLIGPDDFVFIDGGSTVDCLVDALSETRATFFTNSIPLAQKLYAKGCHTFLPGGEISQLSEVLVGPDTAERISRCHFTIGFWGTNGADPENGFTTPGIPEAAIKQISLQNTERPYVLADSSKFRQLSLIKFADFTDATIITDRIDDASILEAGDIIEVRREGEDAGRP